MGYKLTSFNFETGENEQIDAKIKVPKEPRNMIHGVVMDCNNKIIKNAVVKLFKVKNCDHHQELEPITHAFTDEYGQFMLGPLEAHCKYLIKVWVQHVTFRNLVIEPEECHHECGHDHECEHDHDHECVHEDNKHIDNKSQKIKPVKNKHNELKGINANIMQNNQQFLDLDIDDNELNY